MDESDVFAMTVVPVTEKDKDDALEECGYSELLEQREQLESDQSLAEIFANLQVAAEEYKTLEHSIKGLEDELHAAREKTAAANRRGELQQKKSDEALGNIKAMEERAEEIERKLIPQEKLRIREIQAYNTAAKVRISNGPGWTPAQEAKRVTLTTSYEEIQKEAAEVSAEMTSLRLQVATKEKEVESSIKMRDDLSCQLDEKEQAMIKAKEKLTIKRQAVNDEKRNQNGLEAILEQSRSELNDLVKEHEEVKKAADRVVLDREKLQDKITLVSQEHADLLKQNAVISEELKAIRIENAQIRSTNAEMLATLQTKRKEHEDVLTKRSKIAKLCELINQKTLNTEQQRKALDKEKNRIQLDIAQLETELPITIKCNESAKRTIKRLSMEISMVSRKTELARMANQVAQDLNQSHLSTLKSLENEILGMKKTVLENERAISRVNDGINRDESTLRRLTTVCKEKQANLNVIQCKNRQLESSTKYIEERAKYQEERCEEQRNEHNKQVRVLLELQSEIEHAKQEYEVISSQIARVNEDIARTENTAFDDHHFLYHMNQESATIEKEANAYVLQGRELESKKEILAASIDSICRQIDAEDQKREALRKTYRHNIGDKDIVGAQLVATNLEIEKVTSNSKPLQSELTLGSHRFTRLRGELDAAQQKMQELLEEKEFIGQRYDRQVEQNEVLAKLEDDLAKQIGKNQVLTVELGRPINLHRWRELQTTNPEKWAIIEKVHKLQKQVIGSTDKLSSQSSTLESKKKLLDQLKREVANQASVDSIKSHLAQLKSDCSKINKEIKANDMILQQRADATEALKAEVVELEKKSMELKTAYIVSVVSSH